MFEAALSDGAARVWDDPAQTSLNRLPVRPAMVPCPDLATARRGETGASPWWMGLDGPWDFTMLERPEDLTVDHLVQRGDTTIEVPGAWTLQGHDRPHYTNIIMGFSGEPPAVPEANPTGVYRRDIVLPRHWKHRRSVLRVGAAESMLFVYLDGRLVGFSTDSCLPAEFDLSEWLSSAGGRKFSLALVVLKYSAATWLEDQDQWSHGGLQRSVSLYSTAASHLMTAKLVAGLGGFPGAPILAEELVTGSLDCELVFDGPVRSEPGWTAEMRLETIRGRELATTGELELPSWDDRTELDQVIGAMFIEPGVVRARLEVPEVLTWSAESPSQYRAVLLLRDPEAELVEVNTLLVGFRSVEIRDRQLLINGAPVILHGVNVHEHDPDKGRAVPRSLARRDLEMIKAANMNAVRAAHYPHAEHFAEMCDELGLYLLDEANVETHARQASLCHDPRFTGAIVERVQRMAQRDVHHASVIMWSLGNESGYGSCHDMSAAFLRRFDPSRPVHYEGPFMHDLDAEAPVSDVVCPMYSTVEEITGWARRAEDQRRPLILCEYSHAMGNACGSIDLYYEAFEKVEGLQGGFIWEWLEHGIEQPGSHPIMGHRSWAYGGDFGDRPNDANFILDGLVDADRSPRPILEELRWLGRPVTTEILELRSDGARMCVHNRRWFTDTSDLYCDWVLEGDGLSIAEGRLEHEALNTRETRELDLDWPFVRMDPDVEHHLLLRWRRLSASGAAKRNAVVGWDQFELPRPRTTPVARRRSPGTRPGAVVDPVLGHWKPVVFRALTDNDGIRTGWMRGLNGPMGRWVDRLHLDECSWEPDRGILQPGAEVAPLTVRSAVQRLDEGWHRLVVVMDLPVDLDDPPRLGINFEMGSDLDRLEWFGDGPCESYPDRRRAATARYWRSTVWQQYVPYGMPQEHGHHTAVRWLALSGSPGAVGAMIVTDGTAGFAARHHSDSELWAARHAGDLPGPDAHPVTHLYVDIAQRGLGQSSLGPETREEFRIRAGRHRLDLMVRPLDPSHDDPRRLYAERPR